MFFVRPWTEGDFAQSSPAFRDPRRHHSGFNNHSPCLLTPTKICLTNIHPPASFFTPKPLAIRYGTTRKLRLPLLRF